MTNIVIAVHRFLVSDAMRSGRGGGYARIPVRRNATAVTGMACGVTEAIMGGHE